MSAWNAIRGFFVRIPESVAIVFRKLIGQQVVVIGPQKVGKTSLLHFLATGMRKVKPTRTLDATAVDLELRFRRGMPGKQKPTKFRVFTDQPGNDTDLFESWRPAAMAADYLWYLFPAD